MSKLIDSHVSTKQAKLAIDALLKYNEKHQAEKEESELLGAREEVVWLNVAVKKAYPEKKLKPFSIPLARPIVDPRTSPICLITKDPQREYKDLLAAQNVKFVSRVVGVTKLKGKFKPFEARRQLMKDHGIFLVDERVVPMMPKLLGKIFFKAKKQPVPVNLQKKDVKSELERAVSSTYMHQNQGTCTYVR
ncbi:Putative ribosome biogenesis protein C8F11,04 AltName: Full=U3 snoRNP-associated protein C8F11.04 [Rhizoctonia solani AG-1 IB]|uniref:Rhizoctonia solani AG1-IB WGS project CAOJ00000000 data, isolate 7/3/14, contig 10205 n=1 Tax=Thanatephorus cucumeris (strain AG1-IB / isolate 7/3/14) TaxID=1108050 RepID=M5BU71_THACB|nr:Putative ribosome biogenesis protein C8F11,04 AltName: Full=U3 snoRNP-associated protein C8F11.04 [Rhizoctonia solani AG-1 IB]